MSAAEEIAKQKGKGVPLKIWIDTEYKGEKVTQLGLINDVNAVSVRVDEVEQTALNSIVTQTRIPINEISSSRLKTSADADKIKLINLSDEVRSAMAGTTPIHATPAPGSIVEEYYANRSVTPIKLSDSIQSRNLFNKDTALKGYYAEAGSGNIVPNASYFASDFIPITGGAKYTRSHIDQTCYYNASKVYIDFAPNTTTITAPANAAYVRLTGLLTLLDKLQFELGDKKTNYEPYSYSLKYLKIPEDPYSNLNYMERVMTHLHDPFVKTTIKILGDSITAGVGGTGYSPTDEPIGTTGYKSNVTTATCWANSLRNLILTKFNRDHYIELDNPNITNSITEGTFKRDTSTYLRYKFETPNTIAGQSLKFTFFGDHFSIVFGKTSGSGIFDLYVDGVLIANVDTYSATTQFSAEASLTSLSQGYHTIEIKQTNAKNAASVGKTLYLEAIKIPKVVTVKNWGITGITSEWMYANLSQLVSSSDDIVIIQVGTNDRGTLKSPSATRSFFRNIINGVKALGGRPILAVANPVSSSIDNNPANYFKMKDLNNVTREIANEFNMNFISNYDWMQRYSEYTGTPIANWLGDGLHPNDTGYQVMFENFARSLGLSLED